MIKYKIDKMKSNWRVCEGINLKCIETLDVQFFHALLFPLSPSSSNSGCMDEPLDCHNARCIVIGRQHYPSETFPQLRTRTRQTKSIYVHNLKMIRRRGERKQVHRNSVLSNTMLFVSYII